MHEKSEGYDCLIDKGFILFLGNNIWVLEWELRDIFWERPINS